MSLSPALSLLSRDSFLLAKTHVHQSRRPETSGIQWARKQTHEGSHGPREHRPTGVTRPMGSTMKPRATRWLPGARGRTWQGGSRKASVGAPDRNVRDGGGAGRCSSHSQQLSPLHPSAPMCCSEMPLQAPQPQPEEVTLFQRRVFQGWDALKSGLDKDQK